MSSQQAAFESCPQQFAETYLADNFHREECLAPSDLIDSQRTAFISSGRGKDAMEHSIQGLSQLQKQPPFQKVSSDKGRNNDT